MIFRLALFAMTLFFTEQLRAEIIYSNMTASPHDGINLSNALGVPFQEIGDQISLAGSERTAQVASVQFLPILGTGFFDATLKFYDVSTSSSSPVGLQIGGSFTVQNIEVSTLDVKNIDFAVNGINLPNDVVFTLSVSNVRSTGLTPFSIGLSTFNGPTTGRSDSTFLITKYSDGDFFRGPSLKNLSFLLSTTATAVPEPVTLPIIAIGIAATAFAKRRKRRATKISDFADA